MEGDLSKSCMAKAAMMTGRFFLDFNIWFWTDV